MPIFPICIIIFLVAILVILIRKSLIKKHFYKNSITFNFILIFAISMVIVFYKEITNNNVGSIVLNISLVVITMMICAFFVFNSDNDLVKDKFENEIITSLNNYSYYLLLDKKLRIREISSLLCDELDVEKERILNKKIDEIIDNNISIVKINDVKSSNEEFIKYLGMKIDEGKYELKIDYLKNDDTYNTLYLIDSPIYIFDKYSCRMFFYKTSEESINTTLETSSKIDEFIEDKYNSLIDVNLDGVSIIDVEKQTIYLNDYLVTNLALFGNNIPVSLFYNNCNLSDYELIKQYVERATPKEPYFEITYQYKKDTEILFLKQKSKVIFNRGKKKEVISSIIVSKNRNFMYVNNDSLDLLLGYNEFNVKLDRVAKEIGNYELVYFRLANIPEINDKYSRAVGSMVLAEYVKMAEKAFADQGCVFRITGLDFVMIITDITKMEFLRKTLFEKNLLRPKLTYGSININLVVYMGISFSNEAIRPKDIYLNARNSMLKAVETNKEFMFYKDYNN